MKKKTTAALIGIFLGIGSLSAAPQVELDAVGTHIGEEVTVAGEVIAVSVSPRSGARYLNFGDAYPRQKLSAKLEEKDKSLLDRFPKLPGRVVEVTGRVERTPAGPEILVHDAGQLRLLPVEAGNVLAEAGEGVPYESRLEALLIGWLADGKYDELEKLASQWREEKARCLDGRWKLDVFYGVLTLWEKATEDAFAERQRQLDDWARAEPKSVTPVIAAGLLITNHAWAARGTGFAPTVSPEAWKLFYERLEAARTKLESIREQRAVCPQWYAAMQTVALGQNWSRKDYDALCDEAFAREPEYQLFYFARAYWLLPRWHGRRGEWEAFARSIPGDFGVEMRARIAWSLSGFSGNVFRDSEITWPEVNAGFERMEKLYPDSMRIPSYHALLAGQAEERVACGTLLDKLGDKVAMEAWISWANVDFARKWAAAPPPANLRLDPPD